MYKTGSLKKGVCTLKDFIKLLLTKRNNLKYPLIVVFILICGIFYCVLRGLKFSYDKSEPLHGQEIVYDDGTQDFSEESLLAESKNQNDNSEKTAVYYVYVCGSVNSPGVYECSDDLLIYEVIEMAGGFSEDADRTYINLADSVKDGQKLYVPKLGEVLPQEQAGGIEAAKININTATSQQLMTLPGIGESRAKDIIDYRQKNGKFKSISDIKKISGIKDAAFDKIKDLICVE